MEDWELDYDDEPEAWRELDVDGMEALDRSLRCGICGELLTSPVAPKCGHMFCSVCIRRSLAAFNECCPNCRGAASSESLQPCHSLCAVADAFKQARQSVLKACKERMELKKRQTKGGGEEREEKGEPAGHEVDVDLREGSEEVGASPEKGPSYQGRVEGKEACPICNMLIPKESLNSHAQGCLDIQEMRSKSSRPGQRSEAESTASKEEVPQRMGKLHYGLLTDKQLRQKLSDCGLPTKGITREQMISRHSEFVHRFNAAVDGGKKPNSSAIATDVMRLESQREKEADRQSRANPRRNGQEGIFQSLIENVKDRDGLIPGKRKRYSTGYGDGS